MRLLLDNPEFMRHLRKSTRKGKASTAYTIFLVACGLCVAVNLLLYYRASSYQSFQACFRSIFFQIIGANFVLLLGIGAHGCGDSVSSERQSNTLDFQRITGANPYTLAFGKILGVPFVHYLMAAVSMPVTMTCVVYGGVSIEGYALAYLLLAVFGLSYCSVSTLASAFRKEKSANRGSPIVLLLVIVLLGPTLGFALFRGGGAVSGLSTGLWTCFLPFHSLSDVGRATVGGYTVPLYGIRISGIAMTICINALLFLVCWAGTARRLENDAQSIWSKSQLLGGSLVVFILLGSYLWNAVLVYANPWIPIANSVIAAHIMLIIVAAVASPGQYAFRLGLRHKSEGRAPGMALLDERGMAFSLVLTLILAFSGLIVGIVSNRITAIPPFLDLSPIALFLPVLICGMAYTTVAQWFKLVAPNHGMKLYGGALFVWTIIPVVAGLILKSLNGFPEVGTFILFLSPIGTCVNCLQDGGMETVKLPVIWGALGVLIAIAGWLWFVMNRTRRALERSYAKSSESA